VSFFFSGFFLEKKNKLKKKKKLFTLTGQRRVRRLEVGAQVVGGLRRQDRLVDLHLGHAQGLELLEHGLVVRHERLDGRGLVEGRRALGGLGEADQRVGPDEDRDGGGLADGGLAALDAVEVGGEVGGGAWKGGGDFLS
jgi:hypothetical protein